MYTKQFIGVTPDKVAHLRAQLEGHGIAVPPGNSGKIIDSNDNITFTFNYDGVSTLTITISQKPWWMSADAVWSAIQEYLS